MSGLEFIATGANLNKYVINNICARGSAELVAFKPGDLLVSLKEIPVKSSVCPESILN